MLVPCPVTKLSIICCARYMKANVDYTVHGHAATAVACARIHLQNLIVTCIEKCVRDKVHDAFDMY